MQHISNQVVFGFLLFLSFSSILSCSDTKKQQNIQLQFVYISIFLFFSAPSYSTFIFLSILSISRRKANQLGTQLYLLSNDQMSDAYFLSVLSASSFVYYYSLFLRVGQSLLNSLTTDYCCFYFYLYKIYAELSGIDDKYRLGKFSMFTCSK